MIEDYAVETALISKQDSKNKDLLFFHATYYPLKIIASF